MLPGMSYVKQIINPIENPRLKSKGATNHHLTFFNSFNNLSNIKDHTPFFLEYGLSPYILNKQHF